MRREASNLLFKEMEKNKDIYLLTGDLGYGMWDKIRDTFENRFYNVGSSEQLLVGAAVGLANAGKIPVIYSITPFLLYRPFELIRNYLNHEKIPVKLIGGGRNKDYGYLGFSHWAEDDRAVMSLFGNIRMMRPKDVEELESRFSDFLYGEHPSYLNLKR